MHTLSLVFNTTTVRVYLRRTVYSYQEQVLGILTSARICVSPIMLIQGKLC